MTRHAAYYGIKTIKTMTKIKRKTLKKMSLRLTCPPYYTGRFQNRYEGVYREGAP